MTADLAIGVAFLLGGMGLTVSSLHHILKGRASRHWPQTAGVVRDFAVSPGSVHPGDEAWIPSYEYVVGGVTYTSRRYDYAGRNAVSSPASYRLRQPSGTVVTVYYNPRRPGEAVLSPGTGRVNFLALALGLTMLALSVVVFL